MKTTSFVFKILLAFIILMFVKPPAGESGTGGGSGKPITPYKKNEIITEEKVAQIQSLSNHSKAARLPRTIHGLKGITNRFSHFGLYFLQDQETLDFSEDLGAVPENFKFNDCGVKNIRFDRAQSRLYLKGLLQLNDRNKLLNGRYNLKWDRPAEREFRKKFERAVNRIYFSPRMTHQAWFHFAGHSLEGNELKVEFSQIEKITILEVDHSQNKMLLEIEKFPDIDGQELLSSKPTYTELKNDYTTLLKIWINTVNSKAEDLYLASILHKDSPRADDFFGLKKTWFENHEFFAVKEVKIEKLKKGDEITLSYPMDQRNIWFAIPSVIGDKEYPYRVVLLH